MWGQQCQIRNESHHIRRIPIDGRNVAHGPSQGCWQSGLTRSDSRMVHRPSTIRGESVVDLDDVNTTPSFSDGMTRLPHCYYSQSPRHVRINSSGNSKIAIASHEQGVYTKRSFQNRGVHRIFVDRDQFVGGWEQQDDSQGASYSDSFADHSVAHDGSGDTSKVSYEVRQKDRGKKRPRRCVALDPGQMETDDIELVYQRQPLSSSRNGNAEALPMSQHSHMIGRSHVSYPLERRGDECLRPRVNKLGPKSFEDSTSSIYEEKLVGFMFSRGRRDTLIRTPDHRPRYSSAQPFVHPNSMEQPEPFYNPRTMSSTPKDRFSRRGKVHEGSIPVAMEVPSSSPCFGSGCSKSESQVDVHIMVTSNDVHGIPKHRVPEYLEDIHNWNNNQDEVANMSGHMNSVDTRATTCYDSPTELMVRVEFFHSADSHRNSVVGIPFSVSEKEELVPKSPLLDGGSRVMASGGARNGTHEAVTEVRVEERLVSKTLMHGDPTDWWVRSSNVKTMDKLHPPCGNSKANHPGQSQVECDQSNPVTQSPTNTKVDDPSPSDWATRTVQGLVEFEQYNAISQSSSNDDEEDDPLPIDHVADIKGYEFESHLQGLFTGYPNYSETEMDSLVTMQHTSTCTADQLDGDDHQPASPSYWTLSTCTADQLDGDELLRCVDLDDVELLDGIDFSLHESLEHLHEVVLCVKELGPAVVMESDDTAAANQGDTAAPPTDECAVLSIIMKPEAKAQVSPETMTTAANKTTAPSPPRKFKKPRYCQYSRTLDGPGTLPITELKAKLRELGVATTGNKDKLVKRLYFLQQEQQEKKKQLQQPEQRVTTNA